MFDPNYDPYQELEIAKHNIGELIKAINNQSELLKDLSNQHNNLIHIIKDLKRRVSIIETENRSLKSQILPEIKQS